MCMLRQSVAHYAVLRFYLRMGRMAGPDETDKLVETLSSTLLPRGKISSIAKMPMEKAAIVLMLTPTRQG
jgi:hypothetical protein